MAVTFVPDAPTGVNTAIAEAVAHSWYTYTDGDATAKHPSVGETSPAYTGPTPPYDFIVQHDGTAGSTRHRDAIDHRPATGLAQAALRRHGQRGSPYR